MPIDTLSFYFTYLFSHQSGTGYLLGHGYIHNRHLRMFGVGLGHAVAGWTAFRNDSCDLHPLATLDRAEGKLLPVVMGLYLQEKQAAIHTMKFLTSYTSSYTLQPKKNTLIKMHIYSC